MMLSGLEEPLGRGSLALCTIRQTATPCLHHHGRLLCFGCLDGLDRRSP